LNWTRPELSVKASFGARNLIATKDRLNWFGCVGLLLLIACTLYLDLFHGLKLDQDQIAFSPPYRLRQSLAVAISRQHDPRLGGYLAYKSVVNVLNENGFALLDNEVGPHLDRAGLIALLNDGPRLDRIIQEARDVPIDISLTPDIIQGNELGFADYIDFSFRLFGDKISSLYYFFFLIVAVTCLFYVLQFRNSPFMLFLLIIFLSELYFLENYADSYGLELNTVYNSRFFSGLSLLPALHILFVLWQRQQPRAFTIVAVIAQSVIFAFLLSCRTEAAWQVAMLIAVACGMGLYMMLTRQAPDFGNPMNRLRPLWPAAIFLVVVSAYSTIVSMNTDKRYAMEPKGHIIWHEVMIGILSTNMELRREYIGDDRHTYSDTEVYEAVIRDLNARNDDRSPIAKRLPDGKLTIDLMRGWGEYDKLVRSLALRIIFHHPLAVLEGVPTKIMDQIGRYDSAHWHTMGWENLQIPVILIAVGAFVCTLAGGFTVSLALFGNAAFLTGIILLFAAVTPMIEPSPLSIGTLFAYLGVIAIVVSWAAVLLVRAFQSIKSKIEAVSLGAESVQ
jgi:hypothetical protein